VTQTSQRSGIERFLADGSLRVPALVPPALLADIDALMRSRAERVMQALGDRPIGIGSLERVPFLPEVPTLAETLPGFEVVSLNTLFVPSRTPPEIIARIQQDCVAAMAQPDVAARLNDLGVQVVGNTPAQLAALIQAEIPRMAGVLQRAGLRAQ
jgi:tripartite-type tricarboxylate transporter receptor subunit TctC